MSESKKVTIELTDDGPDSDEFRFRILADPPFKITDKLSPAQEMAIALANYAGELTGMKPPFDGAPPGTVKH